VTAVTSFRSGKPHATWTVATEVTPTPHGFPLPAPEPGAACYIPRHAQFRRSCWLGSDPADDEYPDKPPRMRWATYNRLMDRLVAADSVTDEWLKAARAIMDQGRP
jgi:hypothetical protein